MENGMNGDEHGLRHSRTRSPSPGLHRSNSRGSSRECRSLVQRNQINCAKQIRFFRNGDKFHPGLKLAVSPERYKEFAALLSELSAKLGCAVRCIFNAASGKQVFDVIDIEYGASYVCSSACTFIPLDYGQPLNNWSINSKNRDSWSLTKPEVKTNNFPQTGSQRDFIKPKLATFMKNGKPPQKKVTMLLNQKTALNLDQVLDHLSAKGTLGKVDKLCTVNAKPIRELKDLFDDDMMFIALSSQEKYPEERLEIDIHSFKITPYRDLKRPCSLKRSSSLRTPRHRRESDGDLHRPAHPVKRSSSVKSTGNYRNRSQSPGPRYNGSSPKGYRPKSPSSSSGRKTPTGSAGANDELYPAQVFERDPSDSDKDAHKLRKQRVSVHGFYRIGKIIGDGNFAVVRECKHRKTNKEYALKIISKAKVKGKEHMIENEIKILRRVKHEHIVQLIEEYETPKEIFLVMELLKGGDLFEAIVRATKYTERDASHMIRDLTSALEYLHNLNIVHRDIKPENLLVFDTVFGTKSVKLADFGLAVEVKSPMFLVCGTPTYVAPEILDESGYGLKVDIWAAGVICYILLCGFPPFRSPDQDDLFDQILAGEFEYLSPFWDDISHSAKDLIDHMLVVDANKRYSAKQVLHHPWIGGHTANTKDIHVKLRHELTKNFEGKKKLKAAAIAVQTAKAMQKLSNSLKNGQHDVDLDEDIYDAVNGLDDDMPSIQEIPETDGGRDSNSNMTRRDKSRPMSLDLEDELALFNGSSKTDPLLDDTRKLRRPRSLNFDSIRETDLMPLS